LPFFVQRVFYPVGEPAFYCRPVLCLPGENPNRKWNDETNRSQNGFTFGVSRKIEVKCPAKVNLFLAVGPVDSRKYHPIRTIFQAVDLFDTLTLELSHTTEFLCSNSNVPRLNTVTKAIEMVSEIAEVPHLRITLDKNIPTESGLGGGSSDAAGILRAMQAVLPKPILETELLTIAKRIGADVPFFLYGGRARAEGYGDLVEPLPDTPTESLVIAKPNVGCPTAEMYKKLDALIFPWLEFPQHDELYNDFLRVAPPESLRLIDDLLSLGARDATLSGSGSSVFGRFSTDEQAQKAYLNLYGRGVDCWKVRTLTQAESMRVTYI
jgi:4-diphosphocytidyl-2-C-methyl-D-erythritol kinase